MSQGEINIALGCNYLKNNGCIDINAGLFGVLEEKLKQVHTETILPAKNNTSCKCRGTSKCNINCPKAVTVFQVGTHWSPLQKGKRM